MMDDPAALLQYDPAAVAIRASQNEEMQRKLKGFCTNLTKYLNLLQEQQRGEGEQNISKEEDTTSPALAQEVGTDLNLLQEQQRSEGEKNISEEEGTDGEKETPIRRRAVVEMPPLQAHRAPNHQEQQANTPLEMMHVAADETTSSALVQKVGNEANRHHRVSCRQDSGDEDDQEAAPTRTPLTATRVDDIPFSPLFGRVGNEAGDEANKRRRLDIDDATEEVGRREPGDASARSPRQPRALNCGYSGKLVHSQLQRSVGRTRAELNSCLEYLGIRAKFGMTLVSRKDGVMSHLTFAERWNDLPQTKEEKLEFWLGEGLGRLRLAAPLNPLIKYQPEAGLPIFWACASSQKGGALCHYVGHFRCINFVHSEATLKGKKRQVLLEFEFAKYDHLLGQKISRCGIDT